MLARGFRLVAACCVLVACGDNLRPAEPTPTRIATSITPNPLTAGDTATTTCVVYDSHGNEVDGLEPTQVITPIDAGTTITGLTAVLTHADHYSVQCMLPGLAGEIAPFDVVHALPAKLAIAKTPDQPVYGFGTPITISHAVSDRYDNPIDDAVVTTTSTSLTGVGPIMVLSPDVYAFNGEGTYRIDAAVTPPTDQMQPVTA
jgi:hypothetical protein